MNDEQIRQDMIESNAISAARATTVGFGMITVRRPGWQIAPIHFARLRKNVAHRQMGRLHRTACLPLAVVDAIRRR
jgi:hypothetical protein